MDRLVSAIINEVCLAYGIKQGTTIPRTLTVNIEGRIKAFLAVKLDVCSPDTVVERMQAPLEAAKAHDKRAGLTGKWYEGENAKRIVQ